MSTESLRRRWTAEHGTAVRCPYCDSEQTERSAVFGPFHMSETYSCRDCHSPFSRIKWRREESE
jgi:DNA-directed RNA polymerase subunit RPC12/RpoP